MGPGTPEALCWKTVSLREDDELTANPEHAWDLLIYLHKSLEPEEIHPRLLKEMVDDTTGPVFFIFQQSGSLKSSLLMIN